ncbi:phage tail protein [Pacificitalea manganoxidans]|uniref:Phage tail protein n=1 Tax=Pacificitalea manganoxidans TaxID=1411902 RepID=A0A291LZ36_9RHOB|nr:phage tail protein [Pacificitalea manganoxidans]
MEACVLFYRSKNGDTVDRIVWAHYGRQPAALIDAVLKANPGLAGQGALLPAGLRIALPEFAEDPDTASVRLWD